MKKLEPYKINIDYRKLTIRGGNNVTYDFSDFKTFSELFKDLRFEKMIIDDAEMKQDEFNAKLNVLSNYNSKIQKYNDAKNKLLDYAKKCYKGREKIIEGFKEGMFPLKSDDKFEEQQTSKKFNKKEPLIQPTKIGVNELNELITKEGMNKKLFKNYFKFQMLTEMLKILYNLNNRKKSIQLVNTIKSGLSDLKNEIKNISADEIETEKPYKIVDIVEKSLEFNGRNQEGEGLKILTPNQMLSRLSISLAQLKAVNNSEKLKNEIRQLLHSLCRSKKLSKQIYESLIDIIWNMETIFMNIENRIGLN